jgi:hypothetical protein
MSVVVSDESAVLQGQLERASTGDADRRNEK